MEREAFIRELLAAAQESGITEAEVYFEENESMRVMVRKAALEEYNVHTAGGLSLRGLVDGKMGMAYTEAMDRDAIVMLVRGVLESATLISDLDEQFIFAGSPSYAEIDTTGDRATPEARIDLALKLDEVGRGTDPRVAALNMVGVQTTRSTLRIVNTHGLDLSQTTDFCFGYVFAIAREGERVSTGGGMGGSPRFSELDAGKIATEAVEEATALLHAEPCESGEMPIILRNSAMGDLLAAYAGIFSAEAAQKGMSLLKDKEGEMIAAPCVTLVDDPLRKDGIATCAFDAEGVATYTKNVIEAGTLKTLLHNLKTANKAGCETTGNASRSGYAGPIGVAPSNFFIQPGERDLAALEADMGNGLVITEVSGLHAGTNAISGDFSLLSQGYLVENGKRGRAVEQVTVAGNFFQLLKDVIEVGSDLRGQLSNVLSPSVRVKSLSVAGK